MQRCSPIHVTTCLRYLSIAAYLRQVLGQLSLRRTKCTVAFTIISTSFSIFLSLKSNLNVVNPPRKGGLTFFQRSCVMILRQKLRWTLLSYGLNFFFSFLNMRRKVSAGGKQKSLAFTIHFIEVTKESTRYSLLMHS